MKIVYVITRLDEIGGAQKHVHELAKAQKDLGNEVTVLAGGRGPFLSDLVEDGIEVLPIKSLGREIKPVSDCLAFFKLRKLLKDLEPDIVSIHSTKAGVIGRLAARSINIPAIFTAHGWVFSGGISKLQERAFLLIEKFIALLSSKIITVSEYDRQLALEHNFVSPEKIVTIHNGVSDIAEDLRSNPGLSPVNIVMVSRLGTPKDHKLLLQAMAALTEHQWYLHLVGDGPLLGELQDYVEKARLAERVFFLGTRQDIPEQLSKAQISVLISKKEGLPRVILESMRAGLPVIASDVGGTSEMVEDGKTGYLVPESNLPILRDRIEALLKAPHLREAMGDEGRRRYEKHFTLDRMLEETMMVYKSVLSDPSKHLPDRIDQDCNI